MTQALDGPDGTSAGGVAPPEFGGAFAREATLADAPAMLGVLGAAFPRWPAYQIDVPALDHLRWKMETADGETISPHDVVVVDGEVVAAMVAWVGYGRIGEETFGTDRAVDLAVHPDHRGKRFARLIAVPSELRNEDREDYFGFDTRSNAEPVLHMYGADGNVVRGVRQWTREIGLLATAAALRRSASRRGRFGTRRSDSLRASAAMVGVEAVSEFDEAADALWERAQRPFDLIRRRDAKTLNWRYLDPRSGPHVVLAASEGDRLLGYLAYRRPSGGEALVLDVLAEPGRVDVVAALTIEMLRQVRAERARRVRAWLMPDHPYEPGFRAAGLYPLDEFANVEFGTKKLRRSRRAVEVVRDPATSMHVTMGDFDWV